MMSELKPGMKVRVLPWKNHRPGHWNCSGEMDKWQGKVVTIYKVKGHRVFIEEDRSDRRYQSTGWAWRISDFTTDGRMDPNTAFLINRCKS